MTAYYLVLGFDGGTPPTSARRGALQVRCAACLGGVSRVILAAPAELVGELAWCGATCARCHARVRDDRLLAITEVIR